MRKTSLFPVLVLVLVFGLQACNPSKPIPNDTIVVGIEARPEQFDPRLITETMGQRISKLIYNGLLTFDVNLHLVPDVAFAYKIESSTRYKFSLRPNVYFHNGQQLTSEDVKAFYLSMLDDKIKSPFKNSLSIIKNIETPDPLTVVFQLKEPNAPFLTLMTLGIIPKDFVQQDGQKRPSSQEYPPGSGPYRLVSSQNSLSLVTLERFDRYWGEKAKTRKIIFRTIQDSNLRTLELIHHRIDLALSNIPFVMIPKLKEKKDLSYQESTGTTFTYFAINFDSPFLKDRRVREAIAHAIDRTRIIKYKLAGTATPATSFMNPQHWIHNTALVPFEYNPQLAKDLLNETPFKDPDGNGPLTRFTITYKTSLLKERIEIAQLIAEQLQQVGIGVEVKTYEFGTLFRDIRQGNFDVFTLLWSGLTDPDIYYTICHSSMFPPAGANRGHYKNVVLDKLLEQSRTTIEASKQKALYDQIQQVAYNDLIYVPLWYENNYAFLNPRLKGYEITPLAGFVNLVNAYKVNE